MQGIDETSQDEQERVFKQVEARNANSKPCGDKNKGVKITVIKPKAHKKIMPLKGMMPGMIEGMM